MTGKLKTQVNAAKHKIDRFIVRVRVSPFQSALWLFAVSLARSEDGDILIFDIHDLTAM